MTGADEELVAADEDEETEDAVESDVAGAAVDVGADAVPPVGADDDDAVGAEAIVVEVVGRGFR